MDALPTADPRHALRALAVVAGLATLALLGVLMFGALALLAKLGFALLVVLALFLLAQVVA